MKKGTNNLKSKIKTNDEVAKLIKIVGVVIVIYIAFFILTKIAIDKKIDDANNQDELVETTIQFEEIILGNLFDQKESEYYVLVTFENDVYNPLYYNYFMEYSQKEEALPKYNVNINNLFNKKHVAKEANFEKELKFKETTLLKIKYKKVTKVYEGREEIIEHLKKITN